MKYLKFFPIILIFFLTGCSTAITTPVENRSALRYSATTKFENISFKGKYYDLARCWDSKVEKKNINFKNATFLEYQPHNKKAIGYVGWTETSFSSKMYYAIFMELIYHSENETIINAYGVGDMGEKDIPVWLGIIEECESNL